MTAGSPEMEAWVEEARAVPVADAIARYPHRLKRSGAELVGPCPACGGHDRFAINARKNVFLCRRSGAAGDAIALVQYLDGADFLGACEILTGRLAPSREAGRRSDPALIERRRKANERERRAAAQEAIDYRAQEIARAHRIWAEAGPLPESVAAVYLLNRGLFPLPGGKLRCAVLLPYYTAVGRDTVKIHEGPALAAAIVGPTGGFIGVHLTWLSADGQAKAELFSPETGEQLPAKKIRGSAKAGHIVLGGEGARLVVGEGIETTLSAAVAEERTDTLYWAAISLGNLGGPAAGRLAHPTLTRTDSRGRRRHLMLADNMPATPGPGEAVLLPPEDVSEVVILGDGDSEPVMTALTLRRAAKRWERPGRTVRIAWASDGADFNSMLRGMAA